VKAVADGAEGAAEENTSGAKTAEVSALTIVSTDARWPCRPWPTRESTGKRDKSTRGWEFDKEAEAAAYKPTTGGLSVARWK
jgi:hypothetical protein